MAVVDPNLEWLGYVQPVGLVLSPAVLDRYGLVPEGQTRADGDAVAACLTSDSEARALSDPWLFFSRILGWREHQVAGRPGGQSLPDGLSVAIDEADTILEPNWAVIDPEGRPTLLVRIEEAGVALDRRGALVGWEATPHRRFERLLRENEAGVRAGILLTDDQLRLVYAPKGETSGWLSLPLRALATVAGRPMLGGLKLALNAFRLHNDAPERRLPALLKESRDAQAEVSAKLAEQVLGSLHQLLRGLYAADESRITRLAKERPDHLYGGLLTVLLRLVFLLYAEDRGLIPSATDEESRQLYRQGYGVRDLHAKLTADAARYPDTMEERRGAWARLLVLFRLVHIGGGGGFIMGRGGDLFDPTLYPVLLGQNARDDRIAPAPISDGCIQGVLDKLLVLDGERLSYRTLDVEQIGSVYETVMGFTVETMSGPALALRGGKNDKVPVFVDLAELAALKGSERQKRLKETYDVKLPDKVTKGVATAKSQPELEGALKTRVDERASPGAMHAAPGAPLLQPTDERRRTGSHYTPRTLTEPIVRHALEPTFERLGVDAKPEQVLALKVCDPAMGSGAFLVEACRQLAARLVKAWTRWPETRPRMPDDEDEELHARRLVAQRCLYGVDKNPRAVELAKLSLWLATLAREHEFTFLDHSLKCGDSLVGLDAAQIAAMHWDTSKPGLPLFRQFVADRVAEATKARAQIQSAPDDTMRAVLEQKHKQVEESIELVRVLGDAAISAFFAESKPKAREKRRATIESWVSGMGEARWDELRAAATSLRAGQYAVRPFHWTVEFPEVFTRENRGFDAIVGNPPFLGGTSISARMGMAYFQYLVLRFPPAGHHCDLVGYFFRRAFELLRRSGTLGLLATNTISQGDTRQGALVPIIDNEGTIIRAVRRYVWPGEAAVIVSVVHIHKGARSIAPVLDGREVKRISAFLMEGHQDRSPARLIESLYFSLGCKIYGQGFLFDDDDANASPLAERDEIIRAGPGTAARISPYLGGEDLVQNPRHRGNRFVIQLNDIETESGLDEWPALKDIVCRKVLPERKKLGSNPNNIVLKRRWWAYQAHRPELFARLSRLRKTICTPRVSPNVVMTFVDVGPIFNEKIVVIPYEEASIFAVLQSRAHEVWVRTFTSTLKDDVNYAASDCLKNFALPTNAGRHAPVERIGETYFQARARTMIARNEGLTKTYSRFHDPNERNEDIVRLRELHSEMDRAVLSAYGWDDLAARAETVFLDERNEDDHAYQNRLFWQASFRDEVLARLLALNAERAAAERAAGLSPASSVEPEEEEDQEAAD